MKVGLLIGMTIGATVATMAITDMKVMRMMKKAKKTVMHKIEDMM